MQLQHRMDLRDDIADALDIAARLLTRHLGGNEKFSMTARAVLATVADGATRLTGLAESGGVTQPAMTQLVGRLERDGLVIRLIDPDDGRATLVDITDAGRVLLAQLKKSRRATLAELLETLSPSDESTLSLAMRVALPFLNELTHTAVNRTRADAVGRARTPLGA